jgi:peptide/nickel transport system substrate-binding protein
VQEIKKAIFITIAILILSTTFAIPTSSQDEVPYGPWPDTLILFLQGSEDTVVPKIESGELHMWMWWLNTENTDAAEQSDAVELVEAFGLYDEYFVNALETTENFNPFQIREIREALNWLIDREYIVSELFFGRGVPKYVYYQASSPEYARIADYIKSLEGEYAYNYDTAKVQIFNALEEVGAVLEEGLWYYDGEPIVINLLIRIEDERRDAGDYLANQLESLGFTVERLYKSGGDAYAIYQVYAPTKRGDWHIYTGGWISLVVEFYDDDDPWYMMSPFNVPMYEEYSVSPLLREVLDTLNNAEYASTEERNELLKGVAGLFLEDSTHVYFIDQLVSFPFSSDLRDFVFDLNGGSQSMWSTRTVGLEDTGGTVIIGARALFIEGFNPAAGFTWLYDVYSQNIVQEFCVFLHPHTGKYIPLRAGYTVETAGPDGKLEVPSDALMFDLDSEAFTEVGTSVQATSKVTWDFTLGTWHHGEEINKADILAEISQRFRLVLPESDLNDPAAEQPDWTVFVNSFKGIRFLSDNVAEIYVDYWHLDEGYIANIVDVFPAAPWESWALMNEVVRAQEAAWGSDIADIWGVDMLDLTKGTSLPILELALTSAEGTNLIPPELTDFVTSQEASERWAAQRDWYTDMGHFWISAGPYMFDHADPDALQLVFTAFRDYPYMADHWDDMLYPKVPEVSPSTIPTSVVPGLSADFEIAVTVGGTGYDKATMKYILLDPFGEVAGSGLATNLGDGAFKIEFTGEETGVLTVGSYKMLIITAGEEAGLPVTEEVTFTVIPELAYFQTLVEEIQSELGGKVTNVESGLDDISDSITDLTAALNDARNTMNISMAIAAIAIIIAIIAVVLSMKK